MKSTIYLLNQILSSYQLGKKPLLIIGHGRSGTTWIGDTFSKAKGTLLYHEPCNPYLPKGSPMSEYWFKYLSPYEKNDYFFNRLDECFKGLINQHSSIWFRNKTNLLTRLMTGYRIIVKEVASVMCLEWIEKNFDVDVLYVLRHPCSVALSEFERNIDGEKSLEFLLNNKDLLKLFTDEEIKIT